MLERLVIFLVGAGLACAQPPANFEEAVRAAMAPGVAQQRAAVQKQAATVKPANSAAPADSFFTVPFARTEAGTADCDPLPKTELNSLIESASQKSGVDAQLVRAVIDQESGGRPCALSARGAEGLMQLMPETADDFNVQDAFDPTQNVEAGAKLLKSLLNRYNNDASLALSAYNAGATRVDQAGGIPPIAETTDYVAQILEKLNLVKAKTTDSLPAAAPPTGK
ncbi:MAG TPA: lytic transglycosylase domain-containing protein [Bryobacteraceae bacterium]|nr:lytic transglycosylase domain-containing protein [Bryobacteraceae bacterium]